MADDDIPTKDELEKEKKRLLEEIQLKKESRKARKIEKQEKEEAEGTKKSREEKKQAERLQKAEDGLDLLREKVKSVSEKVNENQEMHSLLEYELLRGEVEFLGLQEDLDDYGEKAIDQTNIEEYEKKLDEEIVNPMVNQLQTHAEEAFEEVENDLEENKEDMTRIGDTSKKLRESIGKFRKELEEGEDTPPA